MPGAPRILETLRVVRGRGVFVFGAGVGERPARSSQAGLRLPFVDRLLLILAETIQQPAESGQGEAVLLPAGSLLRANDVRERCHQDV
jgi:hypothetical protein